MRRDQPLLPRAAATERLGSLVPRELRLALRAPAEDDGGIHSAGETATLGACSVAPPGNRQPLTLEHDRPERDRPMPKLDVTSVIEYVSASYLS